MKLLAVDLGLICGWAFGELDAKPSCGLWPLPRRDKRDTLAARIAALRDLLAAALTEWRPGVVTVAAAIRSRNAGEAAYKGGMMGVIREECWRRHIRFVAPSENTVRKQMLGRGSGPTEVMKPLALAWCERVGLNIASHDAADATVLWGWTARKLNNQWNGDHSQTTRQPTKSPQMELFDVSW